MVPALCFVQHRAVDLRDPQRDFGLHDALTAMDGAGRRTVHISAALLQLKSAAILLGSGALETARNRVVKIPGSFVRRLNQRHNGVVRPSDPVVEACMLRILARGPTFRALSLLWPSSSATTTTRRRGTLRCEYSGRSKRTTGSCKSPRQCSGCWISSDER